MKPLSPIERSEIGGSPSASRRLGTEEVARMSASDMRGNMPGG